jgi:hypothetical protein
MPPDTHKPKTLPATWKEFILSRKHSVEAIAMIPQFAMEPPYMGLVLNLVKSSNGECKLPMRTNSMHRINSGTAGLGVQQASRDLWNYWDPK